MIEIGQTYEDLINATYSIQVDGKEVEDVEVVNA